MDLFQNFQATVISSLVTLGTTLVYTLISRRYTTLKSVQERLITYAEKKVIKKAAKILQLSDEHDDLFFESLKAVSKDSKDTENICHIGKYAVVRVKTPAYTNTVSVSEVRNG